jgi:uncharacterized protein with von Willebrand factor type A (vWA) domain
VWDRDFAPRIRIHTIRRPLRRIAEDRMFPLTLDGLDRAMRRLKRRG